MITNRLYRFKKLLLTCIFLFCCSQSNGVTRDELLQYYENQIDNKFPFYQELKNNSIENDTFIFFTDPHCLNYDRDIKDELALLEQNFRLLKMCYEAFSPSFIMCGGDLLNDGGTKSQAIYKLSKFNDVYRKTFENPYLVIGNHDTNYQGDTYYKDGDWESCTLSQEIINNIFFNGGKSYYCFQTTYTSYYCFDTGIDWLASQISNYQKEQIEWFAKSLMTDCKPYIVLFLHIPYIGESTALTAMLTSITTIISSYNRRTVVSISNREFDYTNCSGYVTFIQSGHKHKDVSDRYFENIPIVITDWFEMNNNYIYHPFDVVFSDYTNMKIYCLRFGRGDDRIFNMLS